MTHKVIRVWTTEAFLPAVLVKRHLLLPGSMRRVEYVTGYVGIDGDHPLAWRDYVSMHASAHGAVGELTFSGARVPNAREESKLAAWWFGFDLLAVVRVGGMPLDDQVACAKGACEALASAIA